MLRAAQYGGELHDEAVGQVYPHLSASAFSVNRAALPLSAQLLFLRSGSAYASWLAQGQRPIGLAPVALQPMGRLGI